jgi:tetratricopeptide (TPR) repeat protein
VKNNSEMTPEELEQIELYLLNKMTANEAADFTAKIISDEILKQKVQEVKLLLLGIQEAALSERLDEYHQTFSTHAAIHNRLGIFPRFAKWALAASLLVLISWGMWYFAQPTRSNREVYINYYKPDPGLMTVMSSGTENYAFEKAMVEYKNGAYEQALRQWVQQLKESPANDTLLYFSGAASQASGDLKTAMLYLQGIARNEKSTFRKDACWYLGLIYLRTGERDKAIEFLQQSDHERSEQIIHDVKK